MPPSTPPPPTSSATSGSRSLGQTDQKSLVRASYVATAAVVLAGTAIGFLSDSIRQIWDWLMMALGAAFVVPNVLRWYWWRLNGWGYAAGTLAGLAGAVPILLWTLAGNTEPPLYVTFPALCGISLVATLAGTWLTKPTDENVLIPFYQTVRPFGCWGPIRSQTQESQRNDQAENLTLALTNLVLSSIVILGCYLGPMYLVGHWHAQAIVSLAVAVRQASCCTLRGIAISRKRGRKVFVMNSPNKTPSDKIAIGSRLKG